MSDRLLDGYIPTPHRGKRNRNPRCATKRVKYLFVGGRVLAVWGRWWGRCYSRVERGHTYCVNCRRVQAELTNMGRAPRRAMGGDDE